MSRATTTQSKGDFSVLPPQNVRACQTSFHAIVSQIRFPITFQGPSLRPRNQTVMHGPCSLCGRARPAAGRGIFPPPRPSSAGTSAPVGHSLIYFGLTHLIRQLYDLWRHAVQPTDGRRNELNACLPSFAEFRPGASRTTD